MRNRFAVAALCCAVSLGGCASFAQSPASVQGNVAAAVTDTQTVATGTVTIATDIAKALLAITAPITQIVGMGVSL